MIVCCFGDVPGRLGFYNCGVPAPKTATTSNGTERTEPMGEDEEGE